MLQDEMPTCKQSVKKCESSSDDYFVFTFKESKKKECEVHINIGRIVTKIHVDSGPTVNVTDRKKWESFKNQKIKCASIKIDLKEFLCIWKPETIDCCKEFTAEF